ncbi:Peptidoglycan synthase FtsI [Arsenophonus endosymbiont of Bemisia tabaci Q2]|nr:Peptidoglycan synthase FtsI [Arsenophonus endosymbiont of Bemisia tabaci Q2]
MGGVLRLINIEPDALTSDDNELVINKIKEDTGGRS